MEQQIINLEWGNGQFNTFRFRKTDTIFIVKTRIMTATSIPINKQELIGLNSNSDSLPLYCLGLNNPQTVILIQSEDFTSFIDENKSQKEEKKKPTRELKKDQKQDQYQEREQEQEQEQEKEKEQEREQEQEQEQEKEKEQEREQEQKKKQYEEQKQEKEKEQEKEQEKEKEKEKEQEKEQKREIITLKKSDSQMAKELQEQFWQENTRTPTIKRYHQTYQQSSGRKWIKNTNGKWVQKRNQTKPTTQERITYDSLVPLIPQSITFDSERNKLFNSITNEQLLPAIEENDFSSMCSKAKRESKPILLYFHSFRQEPKLHEDFVQEILTSPEVFKIINQNYIFFVSDVDQKEKQFEELKAKLGIKSSPALLVLSNSTLRAVLEIIQGEIQIDDFIFKLLHTSELFLELNHKNNSKPKLKKSLSVIERESQDLEYEKFFQIDQEKQERLELEKMLFDEKEKEIEKLKIDKENMLKKLKSELSPEPTHNNCNNICRIKCRTKNQNILRRFDTNCEFSQIFSWILVSENDIFNFELIQSYPKKRIFRSHNEKIAHESLKNLNITNQVLFDIRIIESNEDELYIN
ncbi:fas-associated factor [Anaeramoeba flamelloides]|uniref:Fas-associated factor n=1 Tax=Anaeramoeba flamelloides TaxID=1746091 RepID=A0AAV8A7V4_9EUKA|nr:fas-associated factor [Anaeramoeba flamelloides]